MRKQFLIFSTALAVCFLGSCGVTMHRVPPGQSLNVALAQKAVAVERPPLPASTTTSPSGLIAIEPELPGHDAEEIADLVTKANFCMQVGHPREAIAAYQQVISLKPDFAEARYNLAVLYQQTGEPEKAIEEFKRFKEIAQH